MKYLLVVLSFMFVTPSLAAEWPLLPADDTSYRIEQPERVVAFGDIHGDYDALITVLRGAKIIDENNNWIAKNTVVVSLGDLLDRGSNSRAVMEILMKLEKQAPELGGKMVTLLGNHEVLVTQGVYSYFADDDFANYRDFRHSENEPMRTAVRRAFSGDSPIAKWIASRPTAVVIGKTLFVHAGIEQWAQEIDWDRLNATMRAWVRYYQDNGSRPPNGTSWVHNDQGPIWTRDLALARVPQDKFEKWLERAGLDRIVVGHTPVSNRRPQLEHERYHGKFVMIDTGMSYRVYRGRPSAIEWKKGEPLRALVFEWPETKRKEKQASFSRGLDHKTIENCIRLLAEGPDL